MPDRTVTISQWMAAERECWEEGRDYVKVRCAPNGGVLVGDVWCASGLCAAAYILSRWW